MAGNVLEYVAPSRAGLQSTWLISPMSPEVFGGELPAIAPAIATTVATGASLTTLIPLNLPSPYTINQFFWMNGTTTVAGNSLMGVYNEAGTLLVSTPLTANGLAGTLQTVDITDYILTAPARYWIALGTDSATHQYQRLTLSAPFADYLGIKTMTVGISGGALVSPLVFAVGANTCLLCGLMGGLVI